jgi:hypothetical protein
MAFRQCTAVDLAEAFERETGCALHERTVNGLRVLVPDDDRFGAFGILVGRPEAMHFQFRTRAYGRGVELVLYGKAKEKELDNVLRRIV